MQNRECIVFEPTRDTERKIHEPFPCLWVPCWSSLICICICSMCAYGCAFARWNFLLHAAKKNNNAAKFFSLKQNNSTGIIIGASNINFFTFKKRPNISLHVKNSRTLLWFFEDYKFVYKTTKSYAKWLVCNFGQKHEIQYLEKFAMYSRDFKFLMQ